MAFQNFVKFNSTEKKCPEQRFYNKGSRKVAFTQRNYVDSFLLSHTTWEADSCLPLPPQPFTFSKSKEKEKLDVSCKKMDFCRKKSLAGAFWNLTNFYHAAYKTILIKSSDWTTIMKNVNRSRILDVLSLLSIVSKYWHNILYVCKCTHDIFWLKKET